MSVRISKMDDFVYYPSYRFVAADISEAGNIYEDGTPTPNGIASYSIVTPIICIFGIIGNTISLLVLRRRELKGSVYVYLAVLAAVNLCGSILLCISGLSCGIFFLDGNWSVYDILLGMPLAAIFNTMGVVTTVMVTFDRICYLAHPLCRAKPRFCHVFVARRVMAGSLGVSIVFNIPIFFIFGLDEHGMVVPLPLFFSRFFAVYNWIRFIFLGIFPSIYLVLGNGFLICALRKLKKGQGKCNKSTKLRKQNYTHLTTTLILIVFTFLISQIPSMITSRAAASTFLFSANGLGDTCNSKSLEIVRQISTILNALNLSTDFLLYYMFCPAFCKAFVNLFKKKKDVKCVKMNVFVLDTEMANEKINKLTAEKLFEMVDVDEDSICERSSDLNKGHMVISVYQNVIK